MTYVTAVCFNIHPSPSILLLFSTLLVPGLFKLLVLQIFLHPLMQSAANSQETENQNKTKHEKRPRPKERKKTTSTYSQTENNRTRTDKRLITRRDSKTFQQQVKKYEHREASAVYMDIVSLLSSVIDGHRRRPPTLRIVRIQCKQQPIRKTPPA